MNFNLFADVKVSTSQNTPAPMYQKPGCLNSVRSQFIVPKTTRRAISTFLLQSQLLSEWPRSKAVHQQLDSSIRLE